MSYFKKDLEKIDLENLGEKQKLIYEFFHESSLSNIYKFHVRRFVDFGSYSYQLWVAQENGLDSWCRVYDICGDKVMEYVT